MKKVLSLTLALIMTMALAIPALAAEAEPTQSNFTVASPTFPDAYIVTESTPSFQYMDGTSGSLGSVSATVFVDVVDKGKGIEQEFISNVFDRLYTMEDSRNREIQGNGLGLTIAQNLAKSLGGDIFLSSIPNVKTTFTVKLKKISY